MSKSKVLVFLLFLTSTCLLWIQTRPEFSFILPYFNSCECDTCSTDVDPWFITHFNRSIELFMTTKNNLSEFNFVWWKRLQRDRYSYSHYNTTVDKLLQIFPSSPDEPSSSRCRSCSVVGNSGNLKGSHYGQLIDYQDLVIRINKGGTDGYERDVGTRTTHRVMYPNTATNVTNTDIHVIMFPFKSKDLEWLVKASNTRLFGWEHFTTKGMVKILHPVFMKYVHDGWLWKRGQYPSTGFLTLILAIHMCEEVHVFGYGADRYGRWNHYWEELSQPKFKTGNHNGNQEYNIILKLSQIQKVKFYRGY